MSASPELLTAAQRGAASPAGLARIASRGTWQMSRHLDLLNYYLLLVYVGVIKRLMIFMPPRHGKSELTSKYFPAWYLGKRPDHRVILSSYEQGFATHWGWQARTILGDVGTEVFGIRVATDSRAKHRWNIAGFGGGMLTMGVGGSVTGRGGNGLITDDPVKDAEQAHSLAYRNHAWEWWQSTFRTRLEPDGWMIHIQTRWHEDDLAGRILENSDEDWVVLSLPAIADDDEYLADGRWTRNAGEPLWPERWPLEALENLRDNTGMSPYWWSALYQQRPQPPEGFLFKQHQLKRYRRSEDAVSLADGRVLLISKMRRFFTIDLAASTKQTADWTVVAHWGTTQQRDLILLGLERVRLEGPDQAPLITRMYTDLRPAYLAVERTAYQLTMVQQLRRQGLPVRELKADTDKLTRALTAAAMAEGGKLHIPDHAEWVDDYVSELLSFPNARNDDMVDATSYAALEVANMPQGPQLASF